MMYLYNAINLTFSFSKRKNFIDCEITHVSKWTCQIKLHAKTCRALAAIHRYRPVFHHHISHAGGRLMTVLFTDYIVHVSNLWRISAV